MVSERARIVTITYLIADLAMTAAALYAAHAVRNLAGASLPEAWLGPVYPFSRYLPLLGFILPLWAIVFSAVGLYGRKSSRTLRTEMARLVRGITIAGLILAFGIFTVRSAYLYFSRPVILLFLLLNGPFVQLGRSMVRAFVFDLTTRRHVLIAGARDEVMRTAAALQAHRDWGLEVVGLVSDGTWHDAGNGLPVLGEFRHVPALVRTRVVDEVIITPAERGLADIKELEPILLQLEEQGIVTRVLVNFLPRTASEVSFDAFGGMPMLTFSTAPRDELLLFIRRCADVVLSASLLAILSPVFLVVALGIKLTSRGPILYRQIRCGLNGRPFTFLKFRSMRVDADELKATLKAFNEMDGPAFKMRDDPRVTSIGRFLRRTSLDELPQLWNILRGDMSFVGPRPAVVEEVEQYQPWQRRRLSMKPGLTCLWQISGRNELTFDEWMRLDLEYIDNWSLWLDLKIALRTIPAVLTGKGAR